MSGNREVRVYGNTSCPYCGAARMLLTKKSVPFEDIDVAADAALFAEMKAKSQSRTVPQIFVGDTLIGGFEELRELDKSGELDALLGK